MAWQQFAKMLANQHQLVDMLANTPFMRRLAQLTHYAYRRATIVGQQKMNEMLKDQTGQRANQYNHPPSGTASGFLSKFAKNLQTEFEKANKFKH